MRLGHPSLPFVFAVGAVGSGDGGVLQAVVAAEAFEAARVRGVQTTAKSSGDSERVIRETSAPSGADDSSKAVVAASTEMEVMVATATGTTLAANRERISIGARVRMPLMVSCLYPISGVI